MGELLSCFSKQTETKFTEVKIAQTEDELVQNCSLASYVQTHTAVNLPGEVLTYDWGEQFIEQISAKIEKRFANGYSFGNTTRATGSSTELSAVRVELTSSGSADGPEVKSIPKEKSKKVKKKKFKALKKLKILGEMQKEAKVLVKSGVEEIGQAISFIEKEVQAIHTTKQRKVHPQENGTPQKKEGTSGLVKSNIGDTKHNKDEEQYIMEAWVAPKTDQQTPKYDHKLLKTFKQSKENDLKKTTQKKEEKIVHSDVQESATLQVSTTPQKYEHKVIMVQSAPEYQIKRRTPEESTAGEHEGNDETFDEPTIVYITCGESRIRLIKVREAKKMF